MFEGPEPPDGLIPYLDARARVGQALYGDNWDEINAAAQQRRVAVGQLIFGYEVGVLADALKPIADEAVKGARASHRYLTKADTRLVEACSSGLVRCYYFDRGAAFARQIPTDYWLDPSADWVARHGRFGVREGDDWKAIEGLPSVFVDKGDLEALLDQIGATVPDQGHNSGAGKRDSQIGDQGHKKACRGGGRRPGDYFRPLKKHLKWRHKHLGDLGTTPLQDICKDARDRLKTDGVKEIPKKRALEPPVKKILRELGVER